MEYYSSHINKLIEQLSHLPGIGAKFFIQKIML